MLLNTVGGQGDTRFRGWLSRQYGHLSVRPQNYQLHLLKERGSEGNTTITQYTQHPKTQFKLQDTKTQYTQYMGNTKQK
jgi:hypothetical protein